MRTRIPHASSRPINGSPRNVPSKTVAEPENSAINGDTVTVIKAMVRMLVFTSIVSSNHASLTRSSTNPNLRDYSNPSNAAINSWQLSDALFGHLRIIGTTDRMWDPVPAPPADARFKALEAST